MASIGAMVTFRDLSILGQRKVCVAWNLSEASTAVPSAKYVNLAPFGTYFIDDLSF